MKYDVEADILIFCDEPPVDAIEESGVVIVSYGESREPVSVEFLNASKQKLMIPGENIVTVQMAGIG